MLKLSCALKLKNDLHLNIYFFIRKLKKEKAKQKKTIYGEISLRRS
jgi:hypothetical protein